MGWKAPHFYRDLRRFFILIGIFAREPSGAIPCRSRCAQPKSKVRLAAIWAGLAGLHRLAGVQLPSGGATEFITFQAMLKSQEVASRLFADENLIQRLFAGEWDESRKSFLQPIPSTLGNVKRLLKPLLTGEGQGAYIAPNAARLAKH